MENNKHSRNYDGSVIISEKDWEKHLDGVAKILDLIERIRYSGLDEFADCLDDCADLLLYE